MNNKIELKLLLPILLIVSSIFSHLLFFPKIAYKIQLTEIVFVLLSLFFLYKNGIKLNRKLLRLDKSFIFLLVILVLNLVLHPERQVFVNFIGLFYLILLYFLLSNYLMGLSSKEVKYVLKKSSDIGFWILTGIGILGFLLFYLSGYSKFVLIYHNYPYFGDVFRIKGFSYSPNLYISLLTLFTILKLIFSRLKYTHIVLAFSLAIISLTKEALLFSAVLFAIVLYKNKRFQKLSLASLVLAGILYVFLSFFIVTIGKQSSNIEARVQTKEPVFSTSMVKIYPTTYFEVVKSGVLMTFDNPVSGVGIGNFRKELGIYQKEKLYPPYFQTYDALDSYTGMASQLGILYLVFLVIFFISVYRVINSFGEFKYPFLLYLIYMLFESIALGTYHFRHYYILFAIIAIFYEKFFSQACVNP